MSWHFRVCSVSLLCVLLDAVSSSRWRITQLLHRSSHLAARNKPWPHRLIHKVTLLTGDNIYLFFLPSLLMLSGRLPTLPSLLTLNQSQILNRSIEQEKHRRPDIDFMRKPQSVLMPAGIRKLESLIFKLVLMNEIFIYRLHGSF